MLDFRFHDDGAWYARKDLVGKLVDALLATDLGPSITHAGLEGEQKPFKGEAAVKKAIANGRAGHYALGNGRSGVGAVDVSYANRRDGLKVLGLVAASALGERRRTILASLTDYGFALAKLLRAHGGLANGFVHPMVGDGHRFPRARPHVVHPRLEPAAILDFVDLRFHESDHERAHPSEARAVASAPTPAGVRRIEKGGVVALRWIESIEDERAVAIAAGRHERWLGRLQGIDRREAEGFNALGDVADAPARREERPPFTFFDPTTDVAYKAIVPDPNERSLHPSIAQLARERGNLRVRLVVPLREQALALRDSARNAGFDAVLYADDEDRLWNPAPPGWWIDDEDPEGR